MLSFTDPVFVPSVKFNACVPVALSTALVIAVLTAEAISLASTTPVVPVNAPVVELAVNVPFATSTVIV